MPSPLPTLQLPLQNQIAISIHAPRPALRDHRRSIELLDDGKAADCGADVELVALVERRFDRLRRAEMNAPHALGHGGGWPCRRWLRARLKFRHRDAHAHAIAHHLDRALLGGVTMDLRMTLV